MRGGSTVWWRSCPTQGHTPPITDHFRQQETNFDFFRGLADVAKRIPKSTTAPIFNKLADNLKPKHGLLKFYKFLRTNVRRAKCIRSSPSMIVNAKNAISGGSKMLTYFFSLGMYLQGLFPYPPKSRNTQYL